MATEYIKDEQGGTFIAASQRPDGTWRKPRRVRDGYVPQEEVPLYESKGKQFVKNKPSYPVGLSAEYVAEQKSKREAQAAKAAKTIPGLPVKTENKKKKKKNKNRNAECTAEEFEKLTIQEPEPPAPKTQHSIVNNKPHNDSSKPTEESSTSVCENKPDQSKRLRNLKKKIREIEALNLKIKNGDIKNPEKEILDKISRKKEILKEIKQLEATVL